MTDKYPLHIEFDAMEYQADRHFQKTHYSFEGSEQDSWTIFRENKKYLTLPDGYRLLKTRYCGICSTDMARADLPFPLPQITGHEIVAMDGNKPVVVEINASHHARGVASDCYFCNNGLANHCPDRLTLGIDCLPGGFAPYILAPKNAIIPLPEDLDPFLAVMVEPLAAAIRAVEKTPLQACKTIAVLGPRRLGSLLLLALDYYRKKQNLDFSLSAIARNQTLKPLCFAAGADEFVLSDNAAGRKFDAVFDTSGSIAGLELALSMAEKYLHIKSTNGQSFEGLNVLTRMVIDEVSLQTWPDLNAKDAEYLIEEDLLRELSNAPQNFKTYSLGKEYFPKAENASQRFDALIVSKLNNLNTLLNMSDSGSLLKPEGIIYLHCNKPETSMEKKIVCNHLQILTSRCGDFNEAIKLLSEVQSKMEQFKSAFFTHTFKLNQLEQAFEYLRTSKQGVKAVIETEEN